MKTTSKLLILFLSATIVSCARDTDPRGLISPPNIQQGDDNDGDNDNGGDDDNDVLDRSDLNGTWVKACESAGTLGFRRNRLTFTNTTVQFRADIHQNDSTCNNTADLEVRSNFTQTTPGFTAGQNSNVDATLQNIKAKFNTNTAATAANVANFCGFSDWAAGVEKDVTGRDCIEDLPDAGERFYQIVRLESESRLFVGQVTDSQDGSSPGDRPTNLESTPYTK